MASFGSFETEREIYSGPTYTVYSARKQGDPKTEYAIKVFSVHHFNLEAESAAQLDPLLGDIERACVERVAVQQKAAAASKFIAPIFETGRDERGVWYATSFYARSVNKIISGRVALNREALQHIILCIAQGALDIKKTCGRSHGEILPSNVQISRSEKLVKADVVLSDPMPGAEAESVNYELSDLRAIGRILLQLVLRREINHEEDFLILPILVSPEWTELFEKDTNAWLALCNKLLDPNLSLEQLTLEQLVVELQKLQPETGISPKVLIAAAAGVLLLGIAAFLLMRPRTQTVEVTSDPPGATILVDKKEQEGKTPLKLKFKKGSYAIEARQESLRLLEQTTNWVAEGGGSAKLHFAFRYGSVAIQSEPGGATITKDGTVIGKTPADGSPFIVPIIADGAEVKYQLAMEEHLSKTLSGIVTNGQRLAFKESLPLRRDSGTIDLDSTPYGTNVTVYWNDKVLISGTPAKTELLQGTYTLTARYKDWPPKQLTVEVKKGKQVSTNFYFEHALVSVETEPRGASVWVGTNELGSTPVNVLRPAGETMFHFELLGFDPTNAPLKVLDKTPGQRLRVSLQSSNGLFELTSDPPNARIFNASGKELGSTTVGRPFTISTNPGTYQLLARLEGLGEVAATLTVQKRQTTPHTFRFDYGSVRLESVPPGAAISVNGKPMGVTPKTLVQKPGATVSYEVASLNYIPKVTEVTLKSHEYDKPVVLPLSPEPVRVALASDPPGAEFLTESGVALKPSGEYFSLPWGPTNLVARHRRLGARTNAVEIEAGKINKLEPFKFIYGILTLTNLEGITVKEGSEEVQSAASEVRTSYEPPGRHTYDLYDGSQKVDTLTTNIEPGLITILKSAVAGDKRNSIGMRLVKVRNLLGAGQDAYVGKSEVTQKEYKAVMGDNPSADPVGDDYPVENVTWEQATTFCDKLTQMDKNPPGPLGKYMLPTGEQWSKFASVPDLKTAVYKVPQPATVGSKPANAYGLYDVLGNVCEWLAGNDPKNKDYIGGSFKNLYSFGGMAGFTNAQQLQLDRASAQIGFRVIWLPGR